MKRTTWYWYEGVTLAVVMLAAFGVYVRMLQGNFLWDDSHLILNNERIQSLSHLGQIFTSDFWQTSESTSAVQDSDLDKLGYYRPAVTLSYLVDYLHWKHNPFGYHLLNLLLHVAVTGLVYLLSREFLKRWMPRFAAALLFAVHPAHAETVSPIWGRTDLLCGLFFLLALFFYLRVRKAEERVTGQDQGSKAQVRGMPWIASLFFFLLALLSKEMAVVFPLFVFILDWLWFEKGWKAAIRSAIPYAAVLVLYLAIRLLSVGAYSGGRTLYAGGVFGTLLTMTRITASYIRLMVWPMPLNSYYLVDPTTSLGDARFWGAFLLLGLLFAGLLAVRKAAPAVFVGGLWFFLLLLPVTNLFPIGGVMMAERFLYLPSIGFCLLVGVGIERGWRTRGIGESALGLAILASIFFGWLTYNRTESWLNEYKFFRAMVWSSPESPMAHNNLGNCLLARREYIPAIREFEKTLALRPKSPPNTHIGLGDACAAAGRYEDAAQSYRKALELNPNLIPVYVNLGNAYHQMEDYPQAIGAFKKVIELSPGLALAHYNLGNEYYTLGRLAEAEWSYKEAVRLEPNLFYAWFMLAKIYERTNRTAEALASWQKCVSLDGQGQIGRDSRSKISEVSQALFTKAGKKKPKAKSRK